MRYRRFGKTNLKLSLFSLGTMRYLASEAIAHQTLWAAIEQGINHIETARGYGASERYLGAALKAGLPAPRDRLIITSKIPPLGSATEMTQAIEQSLSTLGVDYLDCLAIHGLNTWEHLAQVERDRGCMSAVWQAVRQGKIRHVGFSTHAPLEIILRAIDTGFFAFINLHYYFFNLRNAAAIARAADQDMGVFIISPADKGGLLYTPPDRLRDLCQPFSPLHLTYRFLLSDQRITTLSLGAANPSELEPLQLADREQPLSEAETIALDRLKAQLPMALGDSECSQCHQCLPCPEAINIPEMLRLRNLAIAYDMTDYGEYRYRMFENAGHWFPGRKGNRCTDCGDCLPRCPMQLEIPALLRDTHDRLNGPDRRRLWD